MFKHDEVTEDVVDDFPTVLCDRTEPAENRDLALTIEVDPDSVREERVDREVTLAALVKMVRCCFLLSSSYSSPPSSSSIRSSSSNTQGSRIDGEINTIGIRSTFGFVSLTTILAGDPQFDATRSRNIRIRKTLYRASRDKPTIFAVAERSVGGSCSGASGSLTHRKNFD